MAPTLQSSIEILTLRRAIESGVIDSSAFSPVQNSLDALNVSLLEQGFVVRIKGGTTISKPIYFMNLFASSESKPLFQTRLQIDIESGASATWIEATNLGETDVTCWLNFSLSVNAATRSQFTLIQLSELREAQQQTARLSCNVAEGAQFHHLNAVLSEGWHRNEITVHCAGSEASVNLHGFGFGNKSSVVDQQTRLIFQGPNNKSEQIYKNLLADKSRAIFNGSIKIDQPAQKTDASQLHQSILLSPEAEVDTKPELDIYADDVKATHGATIGQLNPDEIFYFQSRGIKAETAKEILCMAFLLDLCDRIPQEQARLYLKDRIEGFWKKVSQ
jgi:Fe-S cluster assembly protein SufD